MVSDSSFTAISIHIDLDNSSQFIDPEALDKNDFECFVSSLSFHDSSNRWHMRLGHPSDMILVNFLCLNNHSVPYSHSQCIACAVGKNKTQPYHLFVSMYSCPLKLVQIDLWGPASCASNGHHYYLIIVDAYCIYTWIYFLKKKNDSAQCFIEFYRLAEKQRGYCVKAV